ncbi:MAG: heme utilization protein [Phaeospirillum sp.]|nr:heme utilization protein [Phaeospirillum sp.]
MHPFCVIACVCLLSAACAAPAAARPPCADSEQVKAAQLRQLHYQLQVAALNCRGDIPEMPAKWQSYVQRHGATLGENAKVLRAYFKGAAAFDRHNTAVTNRESVLVHDTPGYCEIQAPILDKMVTLTPSQLAAFATETIGDPMEVHACPKKATGGKVRPVN